MTDVNIQMQMRGNARQFSAAAQDQLQPVLGDGYEQLVNQFLPERTELVKLGFSFGAQIPTGSAFTLVSAWPTTRAELVLNNADAVGGKSLIIDRVWLNLLTSVVNLNSVTMIGQLAPSGRSVAAAADNTAVLRQQLSGKNIGGAAVPSVARLAIANTAFALTNQWFQLGPTMPITTTAPASPFTGMEADCKGRYIVPPGGAFCLAGLGGTGAGTAIIGVEWHEAILNLG